MDRSAVLIDGGYVDHVKTAFRASRVDFFRLSQELVMPYERFRTYYYHALPYVDAVQPDPDDVRRRGNAQRFLDGLSFLDRFEVRLGHLQRFATYDRQGSRVVRHRQKLVDVLFSVDLVELAWSGRVAHVVIVAGDSDFVLAVRAAKAAGLVVRLVFADRGGCHVDRELRKACDERIELTDAHLARWAS